MKQNTQQVFLLILKNSTKSSLVCQAAGASGQSGLEQTKQKQKTTSY